MTKTDEFRHVLSFIQSHLDKHNVKMHNFDYDVENHVNRGDIHNDGSYKVEVTGSTVRFIAEYSFDFEEE